MIDVYRINLVKERSIAYEQKPIKCSDQIASLLRDYLKDTDREHFVCICLRTNNTIAGINTVSVGSLDQAVVKMRELFKPAILLNAASIVVGHNHPSGNLEPSKEDISLTKMIEKAGHLMDIPLIDHIIINPFNENFCSFLDRGLM